jgi:hypothetical protein
VKVAESFYWKQDEIPENELLFSFVQPQIYDGGVTEELLKTLAVKYII